MKRKQQFQNAVTVKKKKKNQQQTNKQKTPTTKPHEFEK